MLANHGDKDKDSDMEEYQQQNYQQLMLLSLCNVLIRTFQNSMEAIRKS